MVNGEVTKQVEQFRYLRGILTSDDIYDTEIKRRTEIAKKYFKELVNAQQKDQFRNKENNVEVLCVISSFVQLWNMEYKQEFGEETTIFRIIVLHSNVKSLMNG